MFVLIHEVTAAEERERLYRFRYRVYAEEFGKHLSGIDHERKTYSDELDEQAHIMIAVDQHSKRIVGTCRTNRLSDTTLPDRLSGPMQVARMVERFGADRVSFSGGFMVDPAYRGKTVASLLALALFRWGVQAGLMVDIIVAELALVQLYYQMGYRPYAQAFRPSEASGLRLPLILVSTDVAHLEKVDSPFRHLLPAESDDKGKAARDLAELFPDFVEPAVTPIEKRALWASLAHGGPGKWTRTVFDGLPDEEVQGFLNTMPTVKLRRGERLYQAGESERGMGIIMSGRLGVTLDSGSNPHFLAVLKKGELCGEMAGLVGGGRTATLVALEESEVLVLPDTLLDKLEKLNPGTAARLARNINSLLGHRLERMNRQVMKLLDPGPPEALVADTLPAASHFPPSSNGAVRESYSITTLDDSGAECQRLELQAILGWGPESVLIRRAGFRDSGLILDLGSGPGVTSAMLARTFPNATVIGIEPEPLLRERAEKRVAAQGLAGRCSFVEGVGEDIPLEDGSVDYCLARFVFQHVPNPVAILRELGRVTRPGGTVLVEDVDDEGVIVHPEPAGLRDFQVRAGRAQEMLGGDRFVGRKMLEYMLAAGLENPRVEVAPVTSQDLPPTALITAAFSFKRQTLRRSGLEEEADARMFEELLAAQARPGFWLLVPVLFSYGQVR